MKRTGGIIWRSGKAYARVRYCGVRPLIQLACKTEPAALERAAFIADAVNEMVDANMAPLQIRDVIDAMAGAQTTREAEVFRKAARNIVATSGSNVVGEVTVADLAARWVSGELAQAYPDYVKAKRSASKDHGIFRDYVNPIIGKVPVAAVRLVHVESVMSSLPAMSASMRRHVAQCMARLLTMAVYPLKMLAVSPLPRGFLPKIRDTKAKSYLWPEEERLLLGDKRIPLVMRILYGMLAREGMRVSEALSLDWSDLHLGRGQLVLDKNKTDDPRAWAMQPDVIAALTAWKSLSPAAPFDLPKEERRHLASSLRDRLQEAGVDRVQLFESGTERINLRIHDLRATFVTLSLAHGKSETWVRDRTGHRSSIMIEKYRRAARSAADLGIEPLDPLDRAIPELAKRGRKK